LNSADPLPTADVQAKPVVVVTAASHRMSAAGLLVVANPAPDT
jgi:hypothetical protein